MVLRRIFGPRSDEVTGEWRRLHNEEQNDLYSSPNILRVIKSGRMKWARLVAHMGDVRVVYRFLVGKPEGWRPLGSCISNTGVTWQGIDCRLSVDDTIVSKHLAV